MGNQYITIRSWYEKKNGAEFRFYGDWRVSRFANEKKNFTNIFHQNWWLFFLLLLLLTNRILTLSLSTTPSQTNNQSINVDVVDVISHYKISFFFWDFESILKFLFIIIIITRQTNKHQKKTRTLTITSKHYHCW